VILIIHNVRSVHNVGSLFRTADAAGVAQIILSGYTPTPTDRFGRERKDFLKVSLGAEKSVPWRQVETLTPLLEELRERDVYILALEQYPNSKNALTFTPPQKELALIVGSEVVGVEKETLETVDAVLEIPMHGEKESLNVAVAAGIALFTLLR
jgi:tRNA G18 (ribose-2'-O)-methylase SpoU